MSVVLPVYNAGALLADAVESVLSQSYRDFELIAVNDGSTDGSGAVLDRYAAADARVRVVHQDNRKQVASMNRAIAEARGAYIARMDADDRSYPERLARQVAFLDQHPHVGVLGTHADVAYRDRVTVWNPDAGHTLLCWRLLFNTPMVHPSVTMRTAIVRAAGGYSPSAERLEDYDLFYRLSRTTRLANIPERLVWYNRMQETNISTVYYADQHRVARAVHAAAMATYGLTPPAHVLDDYSRLAFLGEEALDAPGWTPQRLGDIARLLTKLTGRFVASEQPSEADLDTIRERTDGYLHAIALRHSRLTGSPRASRVARLSWDVRGAARRAARRLAGRTR